MQMQFRSLATSFFPTWPVAVMCTVFELHEQGFLLKEVTSAVDHVHTGTDALQAAKILQKKSRKCMCIAMIILIVIAIIVVLSIVKPWNKNK
ncbi:hypothetical protein RHSIM_Rhsim06G0159300 [Rhododendron simsii]|uniref:t-SNARE coiled-coil homology domain-containing protein n=1 Tax=Rhododendron simsii TaxID=118357 RepID=A0A834GUU2_RHOSS|nr:hypothetical protein RHSIM_Rhsim06G0159300 [Rhododendron simsii]